MTRAQTFDTYLANASVIARTLRGGKTPATFATAREAIDRQPTKAEMLRELARLERRILGDAARRDRSADDFAIPAMGVVS